jgi:predicted transcriptional regulator
MAEVESARQVLEREREAVRKELRQLNGELNKERIDWHRRISELLNIQAHQLVRGKRAGLSVKEMAELSGITRQRAHAMIRQLQGAGRGRDA